MWHLTCLSRLLSETNFAAHFVWPQWNICCPISFLTFDFLSDLRFGSLDLVESEDVLIPCSPSPLLCKAPLGEWLVSWCDCCWCDWLCSLDLDNNLFDCEEFWVLLSMMIVVGTIQLDWFDGFLLLTIIDEEEGIEDLVCWFVVKTRIGGMTLGASFTVPFDTGWFEMLTWPEDFLEPASATVDDWFRSVVKSFEACQNRIVTNWWINSYVLDTYQKLWSLRSIPWRWLVDNLVICCSIGKHLTAASWLLLVRRFNVVKNIWLVEGKEVTIVCIWNNWPQVPTTTKKVLMDQMMRWLDWHFVIIDFE